MWRTRLSACARELPVCVGVLSSANFGVIATSPFSAAHAVSATKSAALISSMAYAGISTRRIQGRGPSQFPASLEASGALLPVRALFGLRKSSIAGA